jgi:methyl-accepting chemotaxis protein
MDKVVQQNAANAEESASAAEQMNAQAEQLKEYVEELVLMVTGKKSSVHHQKIQTTSRAVKRSAKGLALPAAGSVRSEKKKMPVDKTTKEVRADQVIPFDEDDFEDF